MLLLFSATVLADAAGNKNQMTCHRVLDRYGGGRMLFNCADRRAGGHGG